MSTISFNESLKTAIQIAQSFAKEYHNEKFAIAHLLRALMHKEVGLTNFLKSINKDVEYITEWAEIRMEDAPKTSKIIESPAADEKAANVFEEADNIRLKLGLDDISPICVLAALVKPNVGFTSEQLKSFPLTEKEILDLYLTDASIHNAIGLTSDSVSNSGAAKSASSGALLKYCIDKVSLAKEGKIDPIIGRDKETRMMLEILGRRTKPNVIITGEPGVGKTALLDGFALALNEGKVPDSLKSAVLFEMDMGALVAGASYKGEIEERLKNIIKEVKQYDKAILFIDEIHTLIDPKGPAGGGAANLLKPELARGLITVIGATTLDEYRKIIEPEQAFSRRFEVLKVEEPDIITATKMIQTLLPSYEEHHGLKVDAEVLLDCVRFSKRYIKDRRLPDAAIDLLDRTMAAIKMMNETSGSELENLQKELDLINNNADLSEPDRLKELRWFNSLMKAKLSPVLIGQMEDSTEVEKIELAEELQSYLSKTISKLSELSSQLKETVGVQEIAAVISYKTGIPLGKIQSSEQTKLMQMDEILKKRVVGQDHAVKALADAVVESRSGLNKPGQPIGSFFLLGPTGTGKTEVTKSVADFLFNDEKSMIRFDMSEFKEEHSAALLYGAPPGYVGYEEGGMLVNKIRQQPYSVVLFDEIEKAHPSVFDIFLQILDEGKMHDRLGKEGDFSNALIIFTSNIGSEWIIEEFAKNTIPKSAQLMEIMTKYFRPEFLARLTEIVPFAPISEQNVVKILDIQIKSLLESLDKLKISLELTDDAKSKIALTGFTPKYGARQISGVIRTFLRRPISKMIVSGEVTKGDTIKVQLDKKGELEWKVNKPLEK
jgi:ATP-dependent Clp protease ATP-binding subunit ClpA